VPLKPMCRCVMSPSASVTMCVCVFVVTRDARNLTTALPTVLIEALNRHQRAQ
jgi:hypothetical protein